MRDVHDAVSGLLQLALVYDEAELSDVFDAGGAQLARQAVGVEVFERLARSDERIAREVVDVGVVGVVAAQARRLDAVVSVYPVKDTFLQRF